MNREQTNLAIEEEEVDVLTEVVEEEDGVYHSPKWDADMEDVDVVVKHHHSQGQTMITAKKLWLVVTVSLNQISNVVDVKFMGITVGVTLRKAYGCVFSPFRTNFRLRKMF